APRRRDGVARTDRRLAGDRAMDLAVRVHRPRRAGGSGRASHSSPTRGCSMMELMREGGYMMWLILAHGLLILGLGAWAGVRTGRVARRNVVVETAIDAILFWGVWAAVIGLLGTFVGIYQAAGVLEQFGGASAELIWGGIRVALTTTVFGLL